MALHRDIFWIGRQWAVTGFGMQAIHQKLYAEFDIAVERLWDDDLLDLLHAQTWFNAEDFSKGLAVARARYPKPPTKPVAPLPVEALLQASEPIAAPKPVAPPVVAAVDAPAIVPAGATPEPVKPEVPEPAKPERPAPSFLRMSLRDHPAKLLRVWRARRR